MKHLTIAGAALFACVTTAAAAPNPDQADRFIRDLRAAVDAGPAAIETMQKRRAHQVKLQELEARAKRLFGDVLDPKFGSCVKAAGMLNTVWTNQLVMVASSQAPAARDIAFLSQQSVAAGVDRYACSIEIDALRPQLPQECMVRIDVTNASATMPPRPAHCPKL